MNEMAAAMQAAGHQIHRFGFGQSPFPVPDVVTEALRSNSHQKDYLPIMGLPALRGAVAGQLGRKFGIAATADDVLIGPGSKELMFLLQLALDADLILPAPSWVSYAPQARILGRSVHVLPTLAADHWQLDPQALDDLCRADPGKPRLMILTDPSNPTGTSHSQSRQAEITEVARRHDIICLSDEIYAGLTFKGRHHSMALEYPDGTIVSSGLSKWCGAGGWRLGTFVFPENLRWLLERVAMLASETFTAVSSPIQFAAVRAYEGGDSIDDYVLHTTRILGGIAERVTEKLTESGVSVVQPVGGFYVFPDFTAQAGDLAGRGIRNSQDLCQRLLKDTGVALLPGYHFNMKPESLSARLAFVDFDGHAALQDAFAQPPSAPLDDQFFDRHIEQILTGIDLMLEWLHL